MARRRAAKQLNERDYTLMHRIGQAGIAAETQLHQQFWAGRRIGTAQDRLTQLVKAGYLERTTCDARAPGEIVYTLTRKGRQQFAPAARDRLQAGLPTAKELKQQLMAQDAYHRLAEEARAAGGALVDWRAERELRSAFRRAQLAADEAHQAAPTWEIADGQAVISDATGQTQEIDVEIDGQYYGKMLRQKAARFGAGGRPTVWVCAAHRQRAVTRATGQYSNITVLVV